MRRRLVSIAAVAGLVASLIAGTGSAFAAQAESAAPAEVGRASATAITGSQFNPGLIISDALFFDSNAMTQAQIQAFLQARVGTCTNSYCLAKYSAATASKPADAMCNAFTRSGSTETAAAIIYKVQQACGVSARAILVTLQKEQGLITKAAPTSGAIRIAMGYGCPDTAACDSTYYGFFNQIYQAARQFKRYGMPGSSFNWYPVGQVSNVRYHPNASCGTKAVRIQNRATAALYYYTPYTPNSAALANLGGTGNSCSSYGNRNFWYYFYSWFGNPLAGAGDAAIKSAYDLSGGASGPVGTLPASNCGTAIRCYVTTATGGVYWTASTGAFTVSGPRYTVYSATGGPSGSLGWPLVEAAAQPGTSGAGTAQSFEKGSVYAGPTAAYAVLKPIRTTYQNLSSTRGILGWPTSAQTALKIGTVSGVAQSFEGGRILSSTAGQRVVPKQIDAAFSTAAATLGWPRTDGAVQKGTTDDGWAQSFANGSVYAGPSGAFVVTGPIRTAYQGQKSTLGTFGWPTAAQTCTATGCSQAFDGGTFYLKKGATVAYGVPTALAAGYAAAGGTGGALGWPRTTGAVQKGTTVDGWAQSFTGGTLYAGPSGAFVVSGAIKTKYQTLKSTLGIYGWPTAAMACTATGCSQAFEGGTIYLKKGATVAYGVPTAIAAGYSAAGGTGGSLGWPRTDGAVQKGTSADGWAQGFEKGSIYAGPPGAFAVPEVVRVVYQKAKSTLGTYGWPTGAATCTGTRCTQSFQGGTITTR